MDKQLVEILIILLLSALCTYYHGMSENVSFIIGYFESNLVPLHYSHTCRSITVNPELPLDSTSNQQDTYYGKMKDVTNMTVQNDE